MESKLKRFMPFSGNETPNSRKLPNSAYFIDGHRVIDYVLAIQPLSNPQQQEEQARFRWKFEAAMRAENLLLEYAGKEEARDGKTAYIKVHATWEALARQAELEELQMPLQMSDLPGKPKSLGRRLLGKLFMGHSPFELQDEYQLPRQDVFTDAFSRDREKQFMVGDPETFFSPAQRAFLTWSIISGITVSLEFKTKVKKKKKKNIKTKPADPQGPNVIQMPQVSTQIRTANIQYLLRGKIYTAAYPLHDCDMGKDSDYEKLPAQCWPMRKYLYESWARPKQWYKHQPLDEIRDYYGEKVGLYFAWLGFYTKMLILPSILGTAVFLIGLIAGPVSEYAQSFCSTSGRMKEIGEMLLCRDCAKAELCPYTRVNSFCMYAVLNAIFDNVGTTCFAIFMAIWAIMFLELWKRYQSELCARWEVDQMHSVMPQVRPDYALSVTTTRLNPVTQKHEPYLPSPEVAKRVVASAASVIFFIAVVVALMGSVMVYKVLGPFIWLNFLKSNGTVADESLLTADLEVLFNPALMTTITASLLNGVFIAVMTQVYMKIAWKLTEAELPRTEEEFEQSYIYKVSIFQFVNFYGSLFYLSFVRGQFVSAPKADASLNPKCPLSGCMVDVVIQLAVIMIGKQTMNNFMELGLPLLKNFIKQKKNKGIADKVEGVPRWERDFYLEPVPPINLFDDYLEMLIQFGFVTMFVPAFPLAPLFALLNNIIEIRLDAYKMLTQTRRELCIPYRACNIEPWYGLLDSIGKLAVLTNAFLIALTSNFVDDFALHMYKYTGDSHENKTLVEFMLSHVNPRILCGGDTSPAECYELTHNHGEAVHHCYYRDYRTSVRGLSHNRTWYLVMAAKFGFVIIFEHIVLLVQAFIAFVIPDVPEHVTLRAQREHFLQRQAFKDHEFEQEEAEPLIVDSVDEQDSQYGSLRVE